MSFRIVTHTFLRAKQLFHIQSIANPASLGKPTRLFHTSAVATMPMIRTGVVRDQAVVNGTPDKVFDYMANFQNAGEWDPGCVNGKRLDSGPLKVGSTFDITVLVSGKESSMLYKITELDSEKRHVVLSGQGDVVNVVDIIDVKPHETDPNKSIVDYTADMSLRGWKKPFIIFLGGMINNIGRKAMEGLEKTLSSKQL